MGKFRSFATGALIGAGLGILLAPKEGSETRQDLKKSFDNLVDTIKNIDIEETKAVFFNKVNEIKNDLSNLDKESAKELAEEKIQIVEEKCDELIEEAKKIETPMVEKAATEVKKNVTASLKEVVGELEEKPEKIVIKAPTKKKTTSKTTKKTKKK